MQERFLDAVLGARPHAFLIRFAPVVGVICNSDDYFLRGHNFPNLAEILDKPILRRDRARR